MSATTTKAKPRPRNAGSIEPGDLVRFVRPGTGLEGTKGVVGLLMGHGQVGVRWRWGRQGVGDFWMPVDRRWLKVLKRAKGGGG